VPTIARINISANGGNVNQEPRRAIVCRTYRYPGRGDGRRFESWIPNQLPTHEKRAATQSRGSWSLQFITPKGFLTTERREPNISRTGISAKRKHHKSGAKRQLLYVERTNELAHRPKTRDVSRLETREALRLKTCDLTTYKQTNGRRDNESPRGVLTGRGPQG
jgi:hypothetical protein